jgi:hypothetical protein
VTGVQTCALPISAIPISRSRKFAAGLPNYLAQRATDEKLSAMDRICGQ